MKTKIENLADYQPLTVVGALVFLFQDFFPFCFLLGNPVNILPVSGLLCSLLQCLD